MQTAAQLVECIADLQLGAITPTEWLQQMTEVVGCGAACVISWTPGKPEAAITSYSDDPIQIDPQWLLWADTLVRKSDPKKPGLLDDIARAAGVSDTSDDSPLTNPDLLVAYLDSDPAITLFAFRADNRTGGWNNDDQSRLKTILPGLLKAHLVHKKLTTADNIIDIANNAINAIPRAILGMSPTGEIVKLNHAALELLDGKVFRASSGKLVIDDPKVMRQLNDKLGEIRVLGSESLHQFVWNRSFRCKGKSLHYQLVLRAFPLESWHLESSIHDRFALLIIGCPETALSPTTEQLRDFYDLSNAQARVVVALLEGNDVITSAAKLHISINTIRSHLRGIYEKLGVDNQRDLLRLLSSTLVDYRSSQQ